MSVLLKRLVSKHAELLAAPNMQSKDVVIQCLILLTTVSGQKVTNLTFPDSFLFGAATSAYQIEGAWNESGKGPHKWDYVTHNTQQVVEDGSTGDVSSDSYHRYKEDIAALKELGVDFYRFSISWSRILPSGFINKINPDGVRYYNDLINGLLVEGIKPWVTMYHFDMPLSLFYLGSWNNAKIVEYFTDYADLLFRLFGDRVKTWLTVNEPMMFCSYYTTRIEESMVKTSLPTGITEYLCAHNVLKAHAKVYRLYQTKYQATQQGRVSIVLNLEYPISRDDSAAAERNRDFQLGWFLHPLVYGDYPEIMINTIGNLSSVQGYPSSRLAKFTAEEKTEIKGAYDFIAMNHYSSWIAVSENFDANITNFENDAGVYTYQDPSWETSAASWLKIYPRGFRELLQHIKENYENPEIAITEQGFADQPNTLNDTQRIHYYRLYLTELLNALYEDQVRVIAYTAWSLVDSFEWISGYSIAMGLYHVDFKDENRTRTPKESARFYKNIIAKRNLLN